MRKPFLLASTTEPRAMAACFAGSMTRSIRMEELTMKTLLSGVALATILALTSPGWAQGVTTQGQPSGQNAPGTAGTSKAGVPGLPGGKSGTT